MTRIASFTFNGFQENTHILYDKTGECVVIDPGCSNIAEEQELSAFIEQENLTPVRLINTHCHIDHVMGNKFVAENWNLPLEAHQQEVPILQAAPQLAAAYGLPYKESPSIARFIEEGATITFGESGAKVLFVPGHSPGHLALYHETEKWLIGGDVLFQGSIGRYDLPGGDLQVLMNSILEQLMTLPDDVKVYPGHGPATTIGNERKSNPFILQYAQL